MNFKSIALTLIGVIWFAGALSMVFYYVAPGDNFLGVTTKKSANVAGHMAGSVGKSRHTDLVNATRAYVEQHEDAPEAMASGEAFAPVPFLNQELRREGRKWRVRSTDGLTAEIYEIS